MYCCSSLAAQERKKINKKVEFHCAGKMLQNSLGVVSPLHVVWVGSTGAVEL
jgi:hypothetical protein